MGVNAAVDEQAVESLANVFAEVKAHLDERQRRLLLGAMARELGRGGQAALSAVTGVAKDVIGRGSASLEAGVEPDGRVREPGGRAEAGHRAGSRTGGGLGGAGRSGVARRSDEAAEVDDPSRRRTWPTS
jgi:hypothetical protein